MKNRMAQDGDNSKESTSIVGIVADVKRDLDCDHVASKCSVFGINEQEYNSLAAICVIRPAFFTEEAHRYMVHCR